MEDHITFNGEPPTHSFLQPKHHFCMPKLAGAGAKNLLPHVDTISLCARFVCKHRKRKVKSSEYSANGSSSIVCRTSRLLIFRALSLSFFASLPALIFLLRSTFRPSAAISTKNPFDIVHLRFSLHCFPTEKFGRILLCDAQSGVVDYHVYDTSMSMTLRSISVTRSAQKSAWRKSQTWTRLYLHGWRRGGAEQVHGKQGGEVGRQLKSSTAEVTKQAKAEQTCWRKYRLKRSKGR